MEKKGNELIRIGGQAITKRGREKLDQLAASMLDCFFNEEGIPFSTIISGGEAPFRTAALMELLRRASRNGIPIIILHAGNQELNSRLTQRTRCVYLPKSKTFCDFDLFSSMKPDAIADILYRAGKQSVSGSTAFYTAIELGCSLILQAGEKCSLQNLCTFPWGNMGSYILAHQNELDAVEAMNRLGSLDSGAMEAKVFFAQLKNESLPLADGSQRVVVGLRECMQESACVCLDVMSDTNCLLTELLLCSINLLRSRGFRFLTVIDSIPVNTGSCMMKLLSNRSDKTPTIYLSPDCTAVNGMTEAERHSLMGSPVNLLIFSHLNGNSANLLSGFFSEHDDFNVTTGSGTAQQNLALIQKTLSKSWSATESRRGNIMPEEIRHLERGIALAFPASLGRVYMPIRFA